MRVATSTAQSTLYFISSDHLGSASLTTNASGGFVARQLYDAWGNVRSGGALPTDIGFTAQRQDASTNLVFMHARYYSNMLGRFISADTIVPDPNSPQHFNRYSYANNNPLKFVDPTGHCSDADPSGKEACDNEVAYILAHYGVFLKDDSAIWTLTQAVLVQQVFEAIVNAAAAASGNFDRAASAVYNNWLGVEMVMMSRTSAPGGGAWTPPDYNGNRIELQSSGWENESWKRNTIAEELGHSRDMRSKNSTLLDLGLSRGWGTISSGGGLSNGMMKAVGATEGGVCLSMVGCAYYTPGDEPTVDGYYVILGFSVIPWCILCEQGGHAATGPVEDWGGAFGTFIAPTYGRNLYPMRREYVQQQLALLVNGQ